MENKKDMPVVLHPVFAATFNQMFGEPIPKKEDKPKDKKGGKDDA